MTYTKSELLAQLRSRSPDGFTVALATDLIEAMTEIERYQKFLHHIHDHTHISGVCADIEALFASEEPKNV